MLVVEREAVARQVRPHGETIGDEDEGYERSEDRVALETMLCCRRAGADLVLTYYAKHVAGLLTGTRR